MKYSIIFTLGLTILLSTQVSGQTQDTTIIVNGVCGMCERTIEGACDMEGVSSAAWSSETKILELSFDPAEVSLEEINAAINEAGYDTEYSTASEEAYNSIHACCKYRDPSVQEAHEEKVGNRQ